MDGDMGGADMAGRQVRNFEERGYVVIRGLIRNKNWNRCLLPTWRLHVESGL